MRNFIALIHKDAASDYGVSFPDLPGVVTAGTTLDEARAMAEEALAFHIEGLVADGEAIPEPSRLDEIMAAHEERGVSIANPHVYTLEDGTRYKRAEADQLGFKHLTDPMGLLNPGKMRSFEPQVVEV